MVYCNLAKWARCDYRHTGIWQDGHGVTLWMATELQSHAALSVLF